MKMWIHILIFVAFATYSHSKYSPQRLRTPEELRDFLWNPSGNRVLVVTSTKKICPGAVFANGTELCRRWCRACALVDGVLEQYSDSFPNASVTKYGLVDLNEVELNKNLTKIAHYRIKSCPEVNTFLDGELPNTTWFSGRGELKHSKFFRRDPYLNRTKKFHSSIDRKLKNYIYKSNVLKYFEHHLSGKPPLDRWVFTSRTMGQGYNPFWFKSYRKGDPWGHFWTKEVANWPVISQDHMLMQQWERPYKKK